MRLRSLLFLWGFLGLSVGSSVAQDMEREKEYLRKDSMLWEAYEQRHQEMAALWEFPCYRDDGNIFDWHGLKGRPVLLLYGGLGCMGEDGRKELELLRRQTSLEDLQIVVYWPCRSLKDLQEVKKVFPFDFIFVSDFKLDDSPMKIKYGAQATPTCFLTDEHHVVKVKCGGLRMDLFDKYIKRNE